MTMCYNLAMAGKYILICTEFKNLLNSKQQLIELEEQTTHYEPVIILKH